MRRTLLTFPLLLFIFTVKAQMTDSARNSNANIFTSVQHNPEYTDGLKKLYEFVEANLRYPATARERNTHGLVIVTMVVEKDGSLSQVRVVKGLGDGCDEEAVRIVKLSSPWKPGTQNGHAVRVAYSLPVSFMLNK